MGSGHGSTGSRPDDALGPNRFQDAPPTSPTATIGTTVTVTATAAAAAVTEEATPLGRLPTR